MYTGPKISSLNKTCPYQTPVQFPFQCISAEQKTLLGFDLCIRPSICTQKSHRACVSSETESMDCCLSLPSCPTCVSPFLLPPLAGFWVKEEKNPKQNAKMASAETWPYYMPLEATSPTVFSREDIYQRLLAVVAKWRGSVCLKARCCIQGGDERLPASCLALEASFWTPPAGYHWKQDAGSRDSLAHSRQALLT